LPFDIFDFQLGPAGFKAGGTDMITTKIAITERAKESTASRAGQHRLLGRVIEAGRFALQKDLVRGLSSTGGPKESREQLYLQKTVAS